MDRYMPSYTTTQLLEFEGSGLVTITSTSNRWLVISKSFSIALVFLSSFFITTDIEDIVFMPSIECKDDQELLDYLLTYLTDSAYNYLILDQYPDGDLLSPGMIEFNISIALSQGMVPVMCYRVTKEHYYAVSKTTGLTALIPVDIIDQ